MERFIAELPNARRTSMTYPAASNLSLVHSVIRLLSPGTYAPSRVLYSESNFLGLDML